MDERLATCPFDKSHIVSKLRLPYHLVKCKKNFPNSNLLVCPFDATEYIKPSEFTAHLGQCKKRKRLDVSEEFKRHQSESQQRGDCNPQSYEVPAGLVTDEWSMNSRSNDSDDGNEMTKDELCEMRQKNKTSQALQKARASLPDITVPIGRGNFREIYRHFLNKPSTTPSNYIDNHLLKCNLNSSYSGTPLSNGGIIENIYDDAGTEDDDNFSSFDASNGRKQHNASLIHDNQDKVNTFESLTKVYPFMGRGANKSAAAVCVSKILSRGLNNNKTPAVGSTVKSTHIVQNPVLNDKLRPSSQLISLKLSDKNDPNSNEKFLDADHEMHLDQNKSRNFVYRDTSNTKSKDKGFIEAFSSSSSSDVVRTIDSTIRPPMTQVSVLNDKSYSSLPSVPSKQPSNKLIHENNHESREINTETVLSVNSRKYLDDRKSEVPFCVDTLNDKLKEKRSDTFSFYNDIDSCIMFTKRKRQAAHDKSPLDALLIDLVKNLPITSADDAKNHSYKPTTVSKHEKHVCNNSTVGDSPVSTFGRGRSIEQYMKTNRIE